MYEPSLVARYFHSVLEAGGRRCEEDAGGLLDGAGDAAQELDFLLERDRPRVLLERHLPVLVVLLDGREPHVGLFRNRAGARDIGRDARHALDFVGRDDRTAGETPDAVVDDADAEAVGFGRAAATAATEAVAAEAAAASEDLTVAQRQRLRAITREADVGVGTAEALGLRQRDIRPLAIARIPHRRRRLLIRVYRPRVSPCRHTSGDGAGGEGLEKISPVVTVHWETSEDGSRLCWKL